MKTKFTISLSITIMIAFHLVIIFTNWFVLEKYNNSIKNDAQIINTIGQIRGGSQKYFKDYLYKNFIGNKYYIDEKFTLLEKLSAKNIEQYHEKTNKLHSLWNKINTAIDKCNNEVCKDQIYSLSESFWIEADSVVKLFEVESEEKNDLIKVIFVLLFLEMLFVSLMIIVVYKLVNSTLESQKEKMETYINMIDKYVITSSTDLKGKITYVSDAFCAISGYSKEELIGKSHNIVRHDDMPSGIYEVLWNTIKSGDTWTGEIKNKTKHGSYYWVKAHISPTYEDNIHVGYTAIREDITNKKRIEELSVTDPLTGLYNRRKFHEVVTSELNRIKRDIDDKNPNVHQVFFILLDVDHFKQYNDNYGHDKGDIVLKDLASVLELSLKRATDYAFRLGGEEFGIIVVEDELIYVKELANRIRENIENMEIPHELNSASSYVSASFGIAIANKHFGYELDSLYNRADKALYKAKENGRNRIEVYKMIGQENG